jgi:hypothetical protein
MKKILNFFLIPVCVMTLCGCITFSTFQSAEVQQKGELTGGIGILGFTGTGTSGLSEFVLQARYGLGSNFDTGIKFFGFPPFGGIYGDIRYQFMKNPFYGTIQAGISYFGLEDDALDSKTSVIVYYPAIFFGTERYYGGFKWFHASTGFMLFDSDVTASGGKPGIVAGAILGTKVKFIPEVNVYFFDEVAIMPGIGFQFTF